MALRVTPWVLSVHNMAAIILLAAAAEARGQAEGKKEQRNRAKEKRRSGRVEAAARG